MIYALTPFKALNSFRPLKEITNLLLPIAEASPVIQLFLKTPTETQLAQLFKHLLSLTTIARFNNFHSSCYKNFALIGYLINSQKPLFRLFYLAYKYLLLIYQC